MCILYKYFTGYDFSAVVAYYRQDNDQNRSLLKLCDRKWLLKQVIWQETAPIDRIASHVYIYSMRHLHSRRNLFETGGQIHLTRKQCLINWKRHRHTANEGMDSYR